MSAKNAVVSRAAAVLALLGVALSMLGGRAVASSPSVGLKAAFITTPGATQAPGGTGAVLQVEYAIFGSGYGVTPRRPTGGVPPLSEIHLSLPAGATTNAAGFGVCSEAVLRNTGPSGCPRGSVAGPTASALAEASRSNSTAAA